MIMAVRALKRAFEFDPRAHLEMGTRRQGPPRGSRHRKPRPRLRVELRPTIKSVRIWSHGAEPIVDLRVRGESQWIVLEAVACRHHEAQDENDQRTQTIALSELATALPSSNSPDAAARAVSRINKLLTGHAWQNHNEFLPALIEDIRPSGSTERRYGLEEVDVTIVTSDSGN